MTYMDEFRFDPQYIRHKRMIKVLKEKRREQALFLRITFSVAVALFFFLVIAIGTIIGLSSRLQSLQEENNTLLTDNQQISEEFNELATMLYTTSEIAVELDTTNAELMSTNVDLSNQINEYLAREELFDKYEYAIIREDGSRTDITYDHIKSLEDLIYEKGMSEDAVNLILSIVMTESNGIEVAQNNKSSACGFGQFLSTTGSFVYENLMGMEGYSHEIALDGSANLEMMVEYLSYLDEKYDGNMNSIIKEYRGTDSTEYKDKIEYYLSMADLSLSSISIK